jgi:hypothetical protein
MKKNIIFISLETKYLLSHTPHTCPCTPKVNFNFY